MHRQWVNEIQNLLERYKRGDYAVLPDGESLQEGVPSPLKALLYFYLTNFALMTGDIEKAENYARQARASFGDESQYIDSSSLVVAEILPAFYQGNFTDILDRLSTDDQHHQLKYFSAECYYWQGKFAQAVPLYQEAFSLCEDDRNLEEDARLCLLGETRCYLRQEQLDKAEEFFQILCEDLPRSLSDECEDSSIFFAGELARVYIIQKKIPQARRMVHMLEPTNFRHPYHRAFSLFIQGYFDYSQEEWEQAQQNWQEAVALPIRKFDKLEVLLLLGKLYEQMGEHQDAYDCFRQVIDFPKTFLAKEAEKQITALPKTKKMSRSEEIKQAAAQTATEKATEKEVPSGKQPEPEQEKELTMEEKSIVNAICGTGEKKLAPMGSKLFLVEGRTKIKPFKEKKATKVESEDVSKPLIDEKPERQPIVEEPKQPAIVEEPKQPAIVEEPEQPAIVEEPEQPAIVKEPEQPAIVEEPKQPAIVEEPKQPAIVEEPKQPAIVEEPEQPAIVKEPERQPIVEEPKQPAIVEEPKQPAIVEEPEPPAIVEEPEQPAIVEEPEPPAIVEEPKQTAIVEEPEPPAIVEEPKQTAIVEEPKQVPQSVVVKEVEQVSQPAVSQERQVDKIVAQAPEQEVTAENIWRDIPITSVLLGLDIMERQMRSKVGQ